MQQQGGDSTNPGALNVSEERDEMSIEDWRAEIDAIDGELLRLLNQRATLAIKVGQAKELAGVALCDRIREAAKLFRRIIRESRRVEAAAMKYS